MRSKMPEKNISIYITKLQDAFNDKKGRQLKKCHLKRI